MFNQEILTKKCQRIERKLEQYLRELQQSDEEEGRQEAKGKQSGDPRPLEEKIKALQVPPEGFIPNNSFFRKHQMEATVLLRIANDPQKQRERLCISEHPFGTVKWHMGAHYVLCKGIEKTTAELGLSFLAYNFKRMLNMKPFEDIMRALREYKLSFFVFFAKQI